MSGLYFQHPYHAPGDIYMLRNLTLKSLKPNCRELVLVLRFLLYEKRFFIVLPFGLYTITFQILGCSLAGGK